MKKNSTIIWVIIFLILTITTLTYITILSQPSGLEADNNYYLHKAKLDAVCSPLGGIHSDTSEISTLKYNYKFVVNDIYRLCRGTDYSSRELINHIPDWSGLSCSGKGLYNIDIYRDGILFDHIHQPTDVPEFDGFSYNPGANSKIYRAYGDNGIIYKTENDWFASNLSESSLPEGINGLEVVYGFENFNDGCKRTDGSRKMHISNKINVIINPTISLENIGIENDIFSYKIISDDNYQIKLIERTFGLKDEEYKTDVNLKKGENIREILVNNSEEFVKIGYELIHLPSAKSLNKVGNPDIVKSESFKSISLHNLEDDPSIEVDIVFPILLGVFVVLTIGLSILVINLRKKKK